MADLLDQKRDEIFARLKAAARRRVRASANRSNSTGRLFHAINARQHARMLVLTRKPNQSIMIGEEIEITVLAIGSDKVRLGIRAPREIPVYRRELYLHIQPEREANASNVPARATPESTHAAARSEDVGRP